MSFFAVSLDELYQLRTQLQTCTEDLRQVASELRGAGPGRLGTPGLNQACSEFGETWGHGIDKIAEGANRIDQGMWRACEAYAGAEEALARMYANAAAGGGMGALGGGFG